MESFRNLATGYVPLLSAGSGTSIGFNWIYEKSTEQNKEPRDQMYESKMRVKTLTSALSHAGTKVNSVSNGEASHGYERNMPTGNTEVSWTLRRWMSRPYCVTSHLSIA